MKTWLLTILTAFAGCSPSFALEPLTPISFFGGVDYSKIPSEIDDSRAVDSSNMIGNREGSAETRFGSHRLNTTAVSSNPMTALYSTTVTTGTRRVTALIGVSGDTIYYSTENTFLGWSILYRGLSTPNQSFTFAEAQNSIYMTGNALTDPIFKWDVNASSFGVAQLDVSSSAARFYAKYLLWEGNYMFAANVRLVQPSSAAYYNDRVYYSMVLAPSSFTVNRFLVMSGGDGDGITGLTSKRSSSVGTRIVEVYKPSSIQSISFSIINPAGEGGDQQVTKIAEGFGHIAESPPENTGALDFMLSKDGIIQWDGGLLFRANLEAEKQLISRRIKPVIDKLIARNSYRNAILKHYPKRNWLMFAYEDPDLFPKGTPNSCMIYDIVTTEWWPQKNWIIGSMETDNGALGTGNLIYGDGKDGYAHITDNPIDSDDSRKEVSLDSMESNLGWGGAGVSSATVAVGTASLTLTLTPAVLTSSISKVFVMPMGEWYDKSQSSNTDLISFKVWPSSRPTVTRIRIDLLVESVKNNFTLNFSSVVISSASLTAGTSAWTTVEIALSSFPILNSWISQDTEQFPFARNLTRFGIRFVATATADQVLYFDDLRIVQRNKNPLNPSRSSKSFSLGTLNPKEFYQVLLGVEKSRDASFNVDVFSGFGNYENTAPVPADIPKEIFVCGYNGSTGIARLSSVDFNFQGGTFTANSDAFIFNEGSSDKDFVYSYDNQNERLVKISRSSFTVFVSTYGQLGSGTTNFNWVQSISPDSKIDGNVLVTDHMNNRIKEHSKKNFVFIRRYGQIGLGTTSFYNPTASDRDDSGYYVGDDMGQRIVKQNTSFGIIGETKLDINTIGNITLKVDDEYVYDAYTRGSETDIFFTDIVLEKRNKGDLSLVNRVSVLPVGITNSSSYTIRGCIALHGRYVFVSFNNAGASGGKFYIQKRLKSDFSLVSESASDAPQYGLIGDGLAREPSKKLQKIDLGTLPNEYVQFRFYQKDELDGPFKLNSMSIVAEKQSYTK